MTKIIRQSTVQLVALAAVCFAFCVPSASAQPSFRDRVKVRVVVQEGSVTPGSEAMLGIILDIQHGWKVQAGKGSGDEVPPYIPTAIEVKTPRGWTLGTLKWPESKSFNLAGEQLRVYDGQMLAAIPVRIPADESPGLYVVQATVNYQACDNSLCEMPTSAMGVGDVRVIAPGSSSTAPAVDAATAELFRKTLARPTPATVDFRPATIPNGDRSADRLGENREQSFFAAYWYVWVILGVVILGGVGFVAWFVFLR